MESIPESLRYADGQYVPERFRTLWRTPRPEDVARFVRVVHAVHMVWFPVWQPRGTGVLTTRGRRSGVARHTPVKAARDGDRAYLVSIGGTGAQWYRNLRAEPRVRLQLPAENGWAGGVFEGVARELRDDAERAQAYAALCERVHPFDWVENSAHRRGLPSRAKIVELHRSWFVCGHPLVVDLGDEPVSKRRWPFSPHTF